MHTRPDITGALLALLLLVAPGAFAELPPCDIAASDDSTGLPAGGVPPLVIAEIEPGESIVLANTTDEAIALAGVAHQLCSPFSYAALANLAPGVVVPARGRAALAWPSGFSDTDAGGEVILYVSGSFGTSTDIADFVCWGDNPHASRKSQAESVGKWSDGCAPALSMGAIERLPETPGVSAASYDTAQAPAGEMCPEPASAGAAVIAIAALALRGRRGAEPEETQQASRLR